MEHPALILPAASFPEKAHNQIGLSLPARKKEAELMAMANGHTIEECPSPVEGIYALTLQFLKGFILSSVRVAVVTGRAFYLCPNTVCLYI